MVPCVEDWGGTALSRGLAIFSFEVCVLLLVASRSLRFWCGLSLTLILGKKERAHHPY